MVNNLLDQLKLAFVKKKKVPYGPQKPTAHDILEAKYGTKKVSTAPQHYIPKRVYFNQ